MAVRAFIATVIFCCSLALSAQQQLDIPVALRDTSVLVNWQAGRIVTAQAVKAYGVNRCFVAEPIPDGVWMQMQGKTFHKTSPVRRDDLRHVRALHWDYDNQIHIGEMVCHKLIADRVAQILRTLYEHRYPIQRMVLPDVYDADDERQMRDNNSSCYCHRVIHGSNKLSKHARGLAVDINPLYNPYYRQYANGTRVVQPTTATAYCDRTRSFPYKMERDDLCVRLFTEAGFKWGGNWTSCKDYQHFEWIK